MGVKDYMTGDRFVGTLTGERRQLPHVDVRDTDSGQQRTEYSHLLPLVVVGLHATMTRLEIQISCFLKNHS